jgi:hypothetical protein
MIEKVIVGWQRASLLAPDQLGFFAQSPDLGLLRTGNSEFLHAELERGTLHSKSCSCPVWA